MKIPIPSLASALAVTLILSSAWSLRADDGDTPLEKQMQTLARGTRQLSQQVSDPAKQPENITLLESLKKAASDSKALEPRMTASVASANKVQFLSDYRAEIEKLAAAFNQVEEALKAGKYDQAKSLLATVNSVKKEGHSKFKQE
jgi:soluble cytochrome b562